MRSSIKVRPDGVVSIIVQMWLCQQYCGPDGWLCWYLQYHDRFRDWLSPAVRYLQSYWTLCELNSMVYTLYIAGTSRSIAAGSKVASVSTCLKALSILVMVMFNTHVFFTRKATDVDHPLVLAFSH